MAKAMMPSFLASLLVVGCCFSGAHSAATSTLEILNTFLEDFVLEQDLGGVIVDTADANALGGPSAMVLQSLVCDGFSLAGLGFEGQSDGTEMYNGELFESYLIELFASGLTYSCTLSLDTVDCGQTL